MKLLYYRSFIGLIWIHSLNNNVSYWNICTCNDRDCFYRGRLMKGISLSFFWKPSSGFGVFYTLLALCWYCLINPLYFYLLLRILIISIKNRNYNINAGPQAHRGRVNSINNKLSRLDMEYRKSLYNHNNYHVSTGSVRRLNKEKFSFNNIHMNIGSVRWSTTFSGNRDLPKNRDDLLQTCFQEVDNILKQKSIVYSPILTSLISLRSFSSAPSHSCSKFKFKSLPRYHYYLVLTGKQVVNFVTLRDKLEKGLGPLAVDKSKIRLVFGVIDLIPQDTFKERRNQGKQFGFIEIFSQLKKIFKEMFTGVSYQEEGIEFTFGFEAVDLLFKMINHVIESQGKDPEMIHIWMSFWLAEDDDGHNDDDESEVKRISIKKKKKKTAIG